MWSVTAILPGNTSARCVFCKGENQRQQCVVADYEVYPPPVSNVLLMVLRQSQGRHMIWKSGKKFTNFPIGESMKNEGKSIKSWEIFSPKMDGLVT